MGDYPSGDFLKFRKAYAFTKKWEGGKVDHPADPGGQTNMGITQTTWSSYRASTRAENLPEHVFDATPEQIEMAYYEAFWERYDLGKYPDDVATALFDWAVHSGWGNVGHRIAEHKSASTYVDERMQFLTNLQGFNDFGRGWVRRLEDLRTFLADTYPENLAVVQVFLGGHLIGDFRPTKTTYGTTRDGKPKVMVAIDKE